MGSVIYSAISYSSGNKWVIQAHAIIQMHLKNVVLSKNPTRLYSAITPFYKAQKEEKINGYISIDTLSTETAQMP